jgi:hypothetical protein
MNEGASEKRRPGIGSKWALETGHVGSDGLSQDLCLTWDEREAI